MIIPRPKYSVHGIGIDIIEINRFTDWHTKSKKELARIFSAEEIDYCLKSNTKSAERFAVRFAAREAFFKAFHSAHYAHYNESPKNSFLSTCKHIVIKKTDSGTPLCIVDWDSFEPIVSCFFYSNISPRLSLSHTQTLATAIVVL